MTSRRLVRAVDRHPLSYSDPPLLVQPSSGSSTPHIVELDAVPAAGRRPPRGDITQHDLVQLTLWNTSCFRISCLQASVDRYLRRMLRRHVESFAVRAL